LHWSWTLEEDNDASRFWKERQLEREACEHCGDGDGDGGDDDDDVLWKEVEVRTRPS